MEIAYFRSPRTLRQLLGAVAFAVANWAGRGTIPPRDVLSEEIAEIEAALLLALAEQERFTFTAAMLRKRLVRLNSLAGRRESARRPTAAAP